MSRVVLYGAAYSVYVRIVRLILEELGAPYDLVEIDIFAKDGISTDYAGLHPFGRIPALEQDQFRLFETDAIVQYVLDSFGGQGLIPTAARERARMRQIMRVMDNYAYRAVVWGIYVEESDRGRAGRLTADEVALGRKSLTVLDDLAGPEFLVGKRLSVADFWTLPMLTYLRLAPTGANLLLDFPKLGAWLERMQARSSAIATRFPAELRAR